MNLEHVVIAKEGTDAIARWQSLKPLDRLDLSGADLSDADLSEADLFRAVLTGANLNWANLNGAKLSRAKLSLVKLNGADLIETNLTAADLSGASLIESNLTSAYLIETNLTGADLTKANLFHTLITSIDLSSATGLAEVEHSGPSSLGIDTLVASKGKIPREFLLGCGVPKWMIEVSRLFDPNLSIVDADEILTTKILDARFSGSLFLGGVFISYSSTNVDLAERLYTRFRQADTPAWLDTHDMLPGPIGRQIKDALRFNDVVVLILSEHSLQSDWVWHEIEMARTKEKDEARNVLFPIALDDSWKNSDKYDARVRKAVADNELLLRPIRQNHIPDFSDADQFEVQFERLFRGMKKYHGPAADTLPPNTDDFDGLPSGRNKFTAWLLSPVGVAWRSLFRMAVSIVGFFAVGILLSTIRDVQMSGRIAYRRSGI